MNIKQLKEHLNRFPDEMEVMILDGFNGQGNKRTINFTPSKSRIITEQEDNDLGDCEGKSGKEVVILGYGFY